MIKRLKKLLTILSAVIFIFVGYNSAFAAERVYILPSTTNAKAPKGNVFQLNGNPDKFILLDSTEDGYFVLSQKFCALKPYSKDGNAVAFDPENENSIAYWLNNDYLNDPDFMQKLPKVIIDNLVEREYITEGGGEHVDFKSDYTVKCKVVLLSQTEWSKYNSKFGYADDSSSGFWFLRTVRGLTGAPLVAAVNSPNSGLTVEGKWTSAIGIRPAFHLSKDFFEKASLDMENTGDAVKSIVRKNYGMNELQQVYTYNEIRTLTQTDIAPVADVVTITGRGIVGEKITGTYKFISLDEKSENGTMIQWQKSADGNTWSTILGAETAEYVPTSNDIGCYIRMKVSPMTISMAGESYVSAPLGCKVRAISKPQATNVTIVKSQSVKPGDILDVTYSFYDENRDICSETEYIWESRFENSISAEEIGKTRYFKLSNSEAGKYIRVGVIPKKKTNSADGRKTISGDAAFSEWIKVENLPVISDVSIVRDMAVEIAASKNHEDISIKSILMPASKGEKLTADYIVEENDDYAVVCEWQGADSKYGSYACIKKDSNILEISPDKALWVRAKVYTENSEGKSKAVYSEPVFIGKDKEYDFSGEYILTQKLIGAKKYEIWILNDADKNSYAYSFKIEGDDIPSVISESYLIKTINHNGGAAVIGTLTADKYSSDMCFKAGEITPQKDTTVTISNVLTTAVNGKETFPITQARVFIVEK